MRTPEIAAALAKSVLELREDARVRTAAAVPVKDFARAKRRLRARFDDRAVERILRALLADVLGALPTQSAIERVFVLSDDAAVAAAARAAGASVCLRIPDPGLNPAIDAAAAERRQPTASTRCWWRSATCRC